MYDIEKNVPIPELRRNGKLYPWRELKPGDSFFAPGKTTNQLSGASRIAKRTEFCKGWTFTVRAENGGARVWRLS